jgi:hypothetical protein
MAATGYLLQKKVKEILHKTHISGFHLNYHSFIVPNQIQITDTKYKHLQLASNMRNSELQNNEQFMTKMQTIFLNIFL